MFSGAKSGLGQPDRQARAKHVSFFILGDDAGAIARRYASAVRFDDLARNRQPKAGILAKSLVWPVRIESIKNSLESVSGNARAVVVDGDLEALPELSIVGAIVGRAQMHANPSART